MLALAIVSCYTVEGRNKLQMQNKACIVRLNVSLNWSHSFRQSGTPHGNFSLKNLFHWNEGEEMIQSTV
jgi:hypothetical protein